MNTLVVVACVRNEATYIEEWIEWHLLQGVAHFRLYLNNSSDETAEILGRYRKGGIVSIVNMPDVPVQFVAYRHAIADLKGRADWVAFIDVDEFLYSPHGPIYKVLSTHRKAAAVGVHWVLYGSNGHEEKSDGLVIERFTKRQAGVDQHVKSICRLAKTISTGNDPHAFKLSGYAVDEKGFALDEHYGRSPKGATADVLRINHYHTKSRGEYMERKKLGDPGTGRLLKDFNESFLVHDKNEIEDTCVADWAAVVKRKIEDRRKCLLLP